MPPEKKISQYKLYKCEWNIGDVFAYKLESEYAIEKGFEGRYAVIYKVDENNWWPGDIVPIVYIGNFKNLSRPADEFVVSDIVGTVTCNWSKFEETIINQYLQFNNKK